MLIGRADTSKMLAPARDTESLMTLWNDFNFALTEPQKDYLNEQNEFINLSRCAKFATLSNDKSNK